MRKRYSLPFGPGSRGDASRLVVSCIELCVVRENHVLSFRFGDGGDVLFPGEQSLSLGCVSSLKSGGLPCFWEEMGCAVLVEELELARNVEVGGSQLRFAKFTNLFLSVNMPLFFPQANSVQNR